MLKRGHLLLLSSCLALAGWGTAAAAAIRVEARDSAEGPGVRIDLPGSVLRPADLSHEPCAVNLAVPPGVALDVATGALPAGMRADLPVPGLLVLGVPCGAGIVADAVDGALEIVLRPAVVPPRKPAPAVAAAAEPAQATAAPLSLQPGSPDAAAEPESLLRERLRAAAAAVEQAPEPVTGPPAPAASDPVSDPGTAPSTVAVDEPLLPVQVWRGDGFGQRWKDLRARASDGDTDIRRAARIDLLKLYVAWDLREEAGALLDALLRDGGLGEDKATRALLAASAVLGRPDNPVAPWLETPEALRHRDMPLWAALLAARQGRGDDALRHLPLALPVLRELPPDLARAFAFDLLAVTAPAGRDGAARVLAKLIEESQPDGDDMARLALLIGRLHAARDRLPAAADQFARAAAAGSPWDGAAELEAIWLRRRQGADSATVLAALTALRNRWRGGAVERQVTADRAALLREAGLPRPALAESRRLLRRFPAAPETVAELAAASALLTEIAEGTVLGLAPADRIALVEENRVLWPAPGAGDGLRRAYAALLEQSGLIRAARAEWADMVGETVDPGEARHHQAALDLALGAPAAALAAVEGQSGPAAAALAVEALLALGRADDAAARLPELSPDTAAPLAARIAWAQGNWTAAAAALAAAASADRGPHPDPYLDVKAALAGYLAGQGPAQGPAAVPADPHWRARTAILASFVLPAEPTVADLTALAAETAAILSRRADLGPAPVLPVPVLPVQTADRTPNPPETRR